MGRISACGRGFRHGIHALRSAIAGSGECAPARPLMGHGRQSPDMAVVSCADVDCDSLGWLRLSPHDVHLMTNAGGIVTDDTLCDLARARTVLGVVRVVVVHHCPCGLMDLGEPGRLEDPVDRLRASLARLLRGPLCLPAHAVHGVLMRATGPLTRIDPPG